jgi:L-asparaginase
LLTPGAREAYRKWLAKRVAESANGLAGDPDRVRPQGRRRLTTGPLAGYAWQAGRDIATKGTVVYLAMDMDGNLAAGTSTSGWAYRYPGRLGDSPIIGAGLYADSRYGACGCSHVGEMTIRAGTARSVVLYMKKGATVEDACAEALRDLGDLRGGFLGPVMIHAMDREGRTCVAANRKMRPRFDAYVWRGPSGPVSRIGPIVLP